jgi:hypothetical protein
MRQPAFGFPTGSFAQLSESGGSASGVGAGVGAAGTLTGGCVGPAEPPPPQRPKESPANTTSNNLDARRLDLVMRNASSSRSCSPAC